MKLSKLEEPQLIFAHGQKTSDPRDGLTFFGPYSSGKINEVHVGLVGTREGIQRGIEWLTRLNSPIFCRDKPISRPFFPGFQAAFTANLNYSSTKHIVIDQGAINHCLNHSDTHTRIFKLCDIYFNELVKYQQE